MDINAEEKAEHFSSRLKNVGIDIIKEMELG
jgi:hypothetical protein